jgi:hypothetical protein
MSATSMSGELWLVKLPGGQVHSVTLDQIDEAFQAGAIDGRAQVYAESASAWVTLATILGDGDRDDSPAPYSVRPISVDLEDSDVIVVPKDGSAATRLLAAFGAAMLVGGVCIAPPELRAAAVTHVRAGAVCAAPVVERLSVRAWGGLRWTAEGLAALVRTGARAAEGAMATTIAAAPAPATATAAAPATAAATPTTPATTTPTTTAPTTTTTTTPATTTTTATTTATPTPTAPATPPAITTPPATPKPPSPHASPAVKAAVPRRPAAHPAATRASEPAAPAPPKPRAEPFTTGGNPYDPLNSSI